MRSSGSGGDLDTETLRSRPSECGLADVRYYVARAARRRSFHQLLDRRYGNGVTGVLGNRPAVPPTTASAATNAIGRKRFLDIILISCCTCQACICPEHTLRI